jgi:hypothetical protein
MKITPLLVFGLSFLPAPVIAALKAKWTRDWPQAMRDMLAKLPPEQAGALHLPVEMRRAGLVVERVEDGDGPELRRRCLARSDSPQARWRRRRRSARRALASRPAGAARLHTNRRRKFEPERLRGFQVDDELEFSGLHDRQQYGTIVATPVLSGCIIAMRGYDFQKGQDKIGSSETTVGMVA